MADTKQRFADLAEYIETHGLKKYAVANVLGVSRYQMSALLYPGRYAVSIDEDLIDRIAQLLNQKPDYVRKLYPKAA
jgi:plasmid maintenance system antidote protein VapI